MTEDLASHFLLLSSLHLSSIPSPLLSAPFSNFPTDLSSVITSHAFYTLMSLKIMSSNKTYLWTLYFQNVPVYLQSPFWYLESISDFYGHHKTIEIHATMSTFNPYTCILVSLVRHKKYHRLGVFTQQQCIFSQFWRADVRLQGAGVVEFWQKFLLGLADCLLHAVCSHGFSWMCVEKKCYLFLLVRH